MSAIIDATIVRSENGPTEAIKLSIDWWDSSGRISFCSPEMKRTIVFNRKPFVRQVEACSTSIFFMLDPHSDSVNSHREKMPPVKMTGDDISITLTFTAPLMTLTFFKLPMLTALDAI